MQYAAEPTYQQGSNPTVPESERRWLQELRQQRENDVKTEMI
jgi:hypothetical protein